MIIYAIDPGQYKSGYIKLDECKLDASGYVENMQMQEVFADACNEKDTGLDVRIYCEMITPRTLPSKKQIIGRSTIDTAVVIGIYTEMCRYYGLELITIPREGYIYRLGCEKSRKFHTMPEMDTQVMNKMIAVYGETCLDTIRLKAERKHVFQALGLGHCMQTLILAGENEHWTPPVKTPKTKKKRTYTRKPKTIVLPKGA